MPERGVSAEQSSGLDRKVPRLWPGSTIVCIGGGPSLTPADVDRCRRHHVIAINDAIRLAPWAEVLYACDRLWWDWHPEAHDFLGLKFSLDPRVTFPGVVTLKNTGSVGLELDPSGLRNGKNGGYQAINLAVHLGAHVIVLLGYDMAPSRETGESHWFGEHPNQCLPPLVAFREKMRTLTGPLNELGIVVVNASRYTELDAFPRLSLEEALCL